MSQILEFVFILLPKILAKSKKTVDGTVEILTPISWNFYQKPYTLNCANVCRKFLNLCSPPPMVQTPKVLSSALTYLKFWPETSHTDCPQFVLICAANFKICAFLTIVKIAYRCSYSSFNIYGLGIKKFTNLQLISLLRTVC